VEKTTVILCNPAPSLCSGLISLYCIYMQCKE